VPRARLGWLPLLAGVAVADAVRVVAAVDAQLKWPNDVVASQGNTLAGGSGPAAAGGPVGAADQGSRASTVVPLRKLGGILAEAAGDAVVVGIGVNVSTGPGELPPPGPGALAATSLRLEGAASLDRERLLAEILAGLERRYRAWCQVCGDTERSGLRAEYTGLCGTIGRHVRVELPGGRLLDGLAAALDADGRLVISAPPDADLPVAAGDIVHLR
jgi:BirA family biotin operon repressor/biotin-[acetyl-CoA-carboxylase] ligase